MTMTILSKCTMSSSFSLYGGVQMLRRHALSTNAATSTTTTATSFSMSDDESDQSLPRIIVSGIQPTGIPTLGNYLGAIRNWKRLQDSKGKKDRIIFSIVDMHAIVTSRDAEAINTGILDMAATLLSCGIDPERVILFQQSRVMEHAQLSWILGCSSPMGRLKRMTQWKDKSGTIHSDKINLGLISYPVLMTADILLYHGTHVPVGHDQMQHLELARDTARTFNDIYNDGKVFFSEPKPLVGDLPRVMSLREPTSKMSKSDPFPMSRINLDDEDDVIATKIRRAKTDSLGALTHDRTLRPGVTNLIDIFAAITGETANDVVARAGIEKWNLSSFKDNLTDVLISEIAPIRKNIIAWRKDQASLESILDRGAERAREIAAKNMADVERYLGFLK